MRRHDWFFVVFFTLFAILVAIAVCGCARKAVPSLTKVEQHLDAAEAHRVRALGQLNTVRPAATGKVREGIVSASNELSENAQGKALADAKRDLATATTAVVRNEAELTKVKRDPFYRFGQFVRRALGVLCLLGIVAFALRAFAGAGIGGSAVSIASHAVWGVLTGGATWVKSAAGWVGQWASGKPKPKGA